MSNFSKDLESWHRIIQNSTNEFDKLREQFNENYPPTKEVTFIETSSGDMIIAAIWFNLIEEGSVSYSYKLPNGLYDPNRLTNIPKEIVDEIRKSIEVK